MGGGEGKMKWTYLVHWNESYVSSKKYTLEKRKWTYLVHWNESYVSSKKYTLVSNIQSLSKHRKSNKASHVRIRVFSQGCALHEICL